MKKNFQNGIFKKSILKKMLLGICLPTVIIYGIAIFCVLQIVEKPVNNLLEQELTAKSQTASSQISEFFTKQDEVVKQMSANCEFQQLIMNVTPGVKITEGERFGNIKRTLDSIHALDPDVICAAWVADEDSSQLFMSNNYISDESWDIHERPWFIEMEKKNGLILSEPYIDVATQELVTTIAIPIYQPNTKNIIGAVGLDFALGSLNTMMKSYTLGENGFFFLTSRDGGIIYHPDNSMIGKSITDMDVSENIKSLLLSKQEGSIAYEAAGQTVYGHVSNIADTGWSVVSGLPEKEFHETRNTIRASISLILGLGIIILAIFIFLISLSIVKPLKKLAIITNELAEGKLDVVVDVHSKDEIGQLAVSMQSLVDRLKTYIVYINEISDLLKQMGKGNLDLTFKQTYDGDFAIIKDALLNTSDMLNNILSEFNVAADQVANGSEQVSAGAQELSQGATEQASAIQELAATINEITSQIKETAENAEKAKQISMNANVATIRGQQQMNEMIAAMDEISNTSNEIGKIIKNIDDIAFQTNILALNAAVEAARAGSAGKGFAVVADEVRNLAGKSAESAKSTATLIESALIAIENGTKIVAETAKSLEEVVSGSEKSTEVIQHIADASTEQSKSIGQVNVGVEQVSAVVQTNSATAEESAAASEELSGQAQMLKDLIGKFKLREEKSFREIPNEDYTTMEKNEITTDKY